MGEPLVYHIPNETSRAAQTVLLAHLPSLGGAISQEIDPKAKKCFGDHSRQGVLLDALAQLEDLGPAELI